MNTIALDTSSPMISLYIRYKDEVIANYNRKTDRGASRVIGQLDSYLTKNKIRLKNFDGLIVGQGPGSFTGLRISFSIMKALSLALQKPLVAVNSLESMAWQLRKKYSDITVVVDARKNLLYYVRYTIKQEQVRLRKKVRLISWKDLPNEANNSTFITYDQHIVDHGQQLYPDLKFHQQLIYPRAKALTDLAQPLFERKQYDSVHAIEPLYVHPKTCQVRKRRSA